jgi:hypothetical protein
MILCVAVVLLCGLIIGLVVAGVEVSKESHVKKGVITDLDGEPTQTGSLESYIAIPSLLKLEQDDLAKVKQLSFGAWLHESQNGMALTEEQSIAANGEFTIDVTINGYIRSVKGIKFSTAQGYVSILENGTHTVDHDGNMYTVILPTLSRRLSESTLEDEEINAFSSAQELDQLLEELERQEYDGRQLDSDGERRKLASSSRRRSSASVRRSTTQITSRRRTATSVGSYTSPAFLSLSARRRRAYYRSHTNTSPSNCAGYRRAVASSNITIGDYEEARLRDKYHCYDDPNSAGRQGPANAALGFLATSLLCVFTAVGI